MGVWKSVFLPISDEDFLGGKRRLWWVQIKNGGGSHACYHPQPWSDRNRAVRCHRRGKRLPGDARFWHRRTAGCSGPGVPRPGAFRLAAQWLSIPWRADRCQSCPCRRQEGWLTLWPADPDRPLERTGHSPGTAECDFSWGTVPVRGSAVGRWGAPYAARCGRAGNFVCLHPRRQRCWSIRGTGNDSLPGCGDWWACLFPSEGNNAAPSFRLRFWGGRRPTAGRFQWCEGTAGCQASPGNCGGGRSQRFDDRCTRHRKKYARQASALNPPRDAPRRSGRNHQNLLGSGIAPARRPVDSKPSVPRAAPYSFHCWDVWGWFDPASGGTLPRT